MTTELEVYEAPAPANQVTLFGTNDPAGVVEQASKAAAPLAEVVNKQRLFATIGGRKHVLVEGWTLLGSMIGVFPVTVWTRKTENGWEARCEARTKDGAIVGAAESQCERDEPMWKSRPDYALRSMAQTRATSKALRVPLGFVMQLAGFNATPAEEMPEPEIVEAEIVADPDGNVFPDQLEGGFVPPPGATTGGRTQAQDKMLFRLRKKLVDDMGQPELAIQTEIDKATSKAAASELITRFKKLAGES